MASAKRTRQRLLREAAGTVTATEVRGDLVAVDEATLRKDGTVPIKIISPGWGSSGYYSAAVLERAATDGVFPAGTQMFWDHPGATEKQDRPERSLRDLAAVTESAAVWHAAHPQGPGLYAESKVFTHYQPILAEMAPHIGVSIRAGAEISTGEAEGRRGRIVERLIEGVSIDFVTRPGRGGQVLAVIEAAREAGLWSDDIRQLLRTALNERFPQDDGQYLWVRDFTDDLVVFELQAKPGPGCFQLAFTLDGDDVTLSDDEPIKVEVHTTYEPVGEARNVGEWFQSRIHLDFTTRADDMFGQGHLTKDERIALSAGIDSALDAFSQTVEDLTPQLLTRDLWADPAATQSQEDDMPITKEEQTAIAAEAASAVITQLTEAGVITKPGAAPVEEGAATAELTEATERADRAERALLIEGARKHVGAIDKVKALPGVARDAVIDKVVGEAKAGTDGKLDTAALDTAAAAAVEAEVKYLTEATGGTVVVGLGESDTPGTVDETASKAADAKLEEAFKNLGLSDDAAKVAAVGRR